MTVIDLTRFFDALNRLFAVEERDDLASLLVVGPGYHEAIIDLLTFFPNAHLTLIDADSQVIEYLDRALMDHTDRISLIASDAANVHEIAPGPHDLVIIRHPDVDRRMEYWPGVFRACTEVLRPEELIVTTSYSLPEASFINQVMESLGLELLSKSPYTAVPVSLQDNDRYILAFRRRRS